MGDYVLTVDDLRAGRKFSDAIATGVFYLDGHKPDDDKRTYILPSDQLAVPPYQIPFRCLLVQRAQNLLAAGRCFSAQQLALSSRSPDHYFLEAADAALRAGDGDMAINMTNGIRPSELNPTDNDHYLLLTGHQLVNIRFLGQVLGLSIEEI